MFVERAADQQEISDSPKAAVVPSSTPLDRAGFQTGVGFTMKRLFNIALLMVMMYLAGSAWRQASTGLRDRPERAMATIVRCVNGPWWKKMSGSTIDVVFTDRQGQRREAKGLKVLSKCDVRGREPLREIAYAAEAPEQAILSSLAFLQLARFLFFCCVVVLLDMCFFHKAWWIVRVLFLSSAAGLLYYFLVRP
jgi:hypothetical protein